MSHDCSLTTGCVEGVFNVPWDCLICYYGNNNDDEVKWFHTCGRNQVHTRYVVFDYCGSIFSDAAEFYEEFSSKMPSGTSIYGAKVAGGDDTSSDYTVMCYLPRCICTVDVGENLVLEDSCGRSDTRDIVLECPKLCYVGRFIQYHNKLIGDDDCSGEDGCDDCNGEIFSLGKPFGVPLTSTVGEMMDDGSSTWSVP